jgi:hypothetical protein
MVHRRLIEGSVGGSSAVDPSKAVPNYKAVQEALFDFLWEDTCNRIRNQKVNEMSVNKYLKEVQAFSFKMCIELDQSVKMPSEDEILMDIGGAIWRSVFDRSEAVEDDHVMEFAKYESSCESFLIGSDYLLRIAFFIAGTSAVSSYR